MSEDAKNRRWGEGRVFQRGNRWWIAFYDKRTARELREVGGDTERKALKKLQARLTEVRGGQFVAGADRLTVADLFDAYEVHLVAKKAKSKSTFCHIKLMREHFGTDRAVAINAERIERFIKEELEAGKKPASVNREVGVLRQAYRLAVKQKRLTPQSVPYFPVMPERNARQGFFGQDEFLRVVAYLQDTAQKDGTRPFAYLADMVRFAYLTGWRAGEIRGLGWSDVDRSDREIRLGDSKNGEGRVLAYDDEIAELIEERWAAREFVNEDGKTAMSPLVFHNQGQPIGDYRKAWATACDEAGVPGKLFHDLRRTAVRNMVRSGVAQSVAMSISGHKTVSMFLRYKITSGDEQREALRRVREHVDTPPQSARVVPLRRAVS